VTSTGAFSQLTVGDAGNFTWGGVISGLGGLTKAGAGAMTITAAQTYTGATNVNFGTLVLATPSSTRALARASRLTVGVGSGALPQALLRTTASFQMNRDGSQGDITILSDGRVEIASGNEYVGAIDVYGGSVSVGDNGNLANLATLTLNGGTISGGQLELFGGLLSTSTPLRCSI
jgi:fibronectin-binding autotransporter adhesin